MASSTTFNDLPLEMKLFILSFFKPCELNAKVAKICTSWRFLCADPFIWRKLWFHVNLQPKPEDIIETINRNQFSHHIHFGCISDFNWLTAIEKHASVRSVDLHSCRLSKSIALQLINTFPNVEKANVHLCDKFEFSDVVLQMLDGWNFLKSFKIDFSQVSLSTYIHLFWKKGIKLEEIGLKHRSDTPIESWIQLLKSRGKYLKYLCLNYAPIDNQISQLIATKCVNLTELKIKSPKFFTDYHLLMNLTHLPCLKILHVILAHQLFSVNFTSTLKNAKFATLTELVIVCCRYFDDKHLKTFVKCCPELKDLNIDGLRITSETELATLPTICGNLELLILENVEMITKKTVEQIVEQLPNICYCITHRCPSINNGNLCRIVDKPKSRMFVKRNSCDLWRYEKIIIN